MAAEAKSDKLLAKFDSIDPLIEAVKAAPDRLTLGQYRLSRLIGRGSMAAVFAGEDIVLKRPVALKVFPHRHKQGERSVELQQFVREARSAARVEHPCVVRIYEIDQFQGWFFIAMELINGTDLSRLVRSSGALEIRKACRVAADAADALHAAHELGVVHRDVKPANLMLTRQGRCKVTDFGLARVKDPKDRFALPTEAVGTPYYIAPEVATGQPATAMADIYSLAATLWYLLTGQPMYNGKSARELARQHVHHPLPNIQVSNPQIPDRLVLALQQALAKTPAERFQNAGEFAQVLHSFHEQDPLSEVESSQMIALVQAVEQAPPETVAGSSHSGRLGSRAGASSHGRVGSSVRRRSRSSSESSLLAVMLAIGSAAIVLAGLGGAAWWFWTHEHQNPLGPMHHPATTMAAASVASQSAERTKTGIDRVDMSESSEMPSSVQSIADVQDVGADSTVVLSETGQPMPASMPKVEPPSAEPSPQQVNASDAAIDRARRFAQAAGIAVTSDDPWFADVDRMLDVNDSATMTNLADFDDPRTFAIQGQATRAELSRSGKTFRVQFNGQHGAGPVTVVYRPELYEAMGEKFGGENGEGLLDKQVLVKGTLSKSFGNPRILVTDPQQVRTLAVE